LNLEARALKQLELKEWRRLSLVCHLRHAQWCRDKPLRRSAPHRSFLTEIDRCDGSQLKTDPYAWIYNLPAWHSPPLALYLPILFTFGHASIKVFVMANHLLSFISGSRWTCMVCPMHTGGPVRSGIGRRAAMRRQLSRVLALVCQLDAAITHVRAGTGAVALDR
jgi:hypothetical protein